MLRRQLNDDDSAADKIIVIALVSLLTVSVISAIAYMSLDSDESNGGGSKTTEWIDPVVEIEDENHSHTDLMAHRLATSNMQLIDYHNLNCDGNVAPPAEYVPVLPCSSELPVILE